MPPYLAAVHRWCRSLALLLLSLLAMSPASADPAGRVGRIAWVLGSVHLHRAESGESSAAVLNWPLTSGDVVSTGAGALAEIQIGSTLLQLASGTVLEFVQLDDQRLALRLLDGSVIARFVSREAAQDFDLATRDGHFQVRDAGRYRFDSDRSAIAGTAYSGALHFTAADTAFSISAGRRVLITNSGQTEHQILAPEIDDFASWSSDRDRQYSAAAQGRYVSPEMTGAADLEAHGDWYESSDYGAVWFPRAVPVDWAPYRSGRWEWLAPWGWTWVGDEPWGFAPFHYGRWAYFRGAWGWVPGRRVARPVYAPALVAWVGTPRAGVAPHRAGRPAVGWFPLAPREVYIPAYRSSARHLREVNSSQVTNTSHLTEIVRDPEAAAARARYAHHRLPQAVTVVPEEAMRQRRHVREAAIRQPDQAALSSQPVQVRAPVAAPVREPRRQNGQLPPERERPQRAAGGPARDAPPGSRGDARPILPAASATAAAVAGASPRPPPLARPAPGDARGVAPKSDLSPSPVEVPASRPLSPVEAASSPRSREGAPQRAAGQARQEVAPGSARGADVARPPISVPGSPIAPPSTPVVPGGKPDRGSVSAAPPAPERRERAADAGGRSSAPALSGARDRRPQDAPQVSTSAPPMNATIPERRAADAPVTVAKPRPDGPLQRPAAATLPQPVVAPQRGERLPAEASRPATTARPDRVEARQPERAPARDDSLRQQRRPDARSDQGLAVSTERAAAPPAPVDVRAQRERPASAERPHGGGRPNEKRADPREEGRGRPPGMQ